MISRIADLKKFVQEQSTALSVSDVLCENCFTPVSEATFNDQSLMRFCDCYARQYAPEQPERLTPLTDIYWRDLRAASRKKDPLGYQMFDALEDPQDIVNPSGYQNYDCWCPGCQRDRKQAYRVPWFAPDKTTLVCIYGACAKCGETITKSLGV